ncbi:nuclear transport factor 2 family protein [Streptomyces luomodiensis]|uniref:Nuclear transport factor 2 family protein n=1 Tax=Streptomyces luomodiensis TaxID=3026192 RepID=A0ABY9V8B4_9ACTN|nr:nuclear transport factor 2 family protein [Streptomyces sp. SCA4-21]WNF01151.1 nuclear transport factor 2 family protein [Streptomyces sp. SCA4-21]
MSPTPTPTPADAPTGPDHDQIQIAQVLHRLARAMDTRDWDLLATCFIPEAVGDFATGQAVGLDRMLVDYKAFLPPLDTTQHLVTNIETVIDGDTAEATAYFLAQHVRANTEGGDQFLIGGRYEDRLTRTTEGWRIARRRVTGTWTQGNPKVVGSTLDRRENG